MLNILSLKKNKAAQGVASKIPKTSAAKIRMQKDLADMDNLPSTMAIDFPDPNDVFNFVLEISPDEGFYVKGTFKFIFKVSADYPHQPPKVLCTQKVSNC